jgi:hypothetical protein
MIGTVKFETFWKVHSKNKSEGYYSEDFKDLITSMILPDPNDRLTLE